mmetsp:Transcript_19847/g.29683  ORF Transcript_19847/g.29683 Transcript_19847/m.29683 type:complete len:1390 (-) Transcript_19847:111-4280(-)
MDGDKGGGKKDGDEGGDVGVMSMLVRLRSGDRKIMINAALQMQKYCENEAGKITKGKKKAPAKSSRAEWCEIVDAGLDCLACISDASAAIAIFTGIGLLAQTGSKGFIRHLMSTDCLPVAMRSLKTFTPSNPSVIGKALDLVIVLCTQLRREVLRRRKKKNPRKRYVIVIRLSGGLRRVIDILSTRTFRPHPSLYSKALNLLALLVRRGTSNKLRVLQHPRALKITYSTSTRALKSGRVTPEDISIIVAALGVLEKLATSQMLAQRLCETGCVIWCMTVLATYGAQAEAKLLYGVLKLLRAMLNHHAGPACEQFVKHGGFEVVWNAVCRWGLDETAARTDSESASLCDSILIQASAILSNVQRIMIRYYQIPAPVPIASDPETKKLATASGNSSNNNGSFTWRGRPVILKIASTNSNPLYDFKSLCAGLGIGKPVTLVPENHPKKSAGYPDVLDRIRKLMDTTSKQNSSNSESSSNNSDNKHVPIPLMTSDELIAFCPEMWSELEIPLEKQKTWQNMSEEVLAEETQSATLGKDFGRDEGLSPGLSTGLNLPATKHPQFESLQSNPTGPAQSLRDMFINFRRIMRSKALSAKPILAFDLLQSTPEHVSPKATVRCADISIGRQKRNNPQDSWEGNKIEKKILGPSSDSSSSVPIGSNDRPCTSEVQTKEEKDKFVEEEEKSNLKEYKSPRKISTTTEHSNKQEDSLPMLRFGSKFESGNLRRAIRVGPCEYDLIVNPDTNTNGFTQWFYFAVENMISEVTYTLNIINHEKSSSAFNNGMQPVMFSAIENSRSGQGWVRVQAVSISYFHNAYPRPDGGQRVSMEPQSGGKGSPGAAADEQSDSDEPDEKPSTVNDLDNANAEGEEKDGATLDILPNSNAKRGRNNEPSGGSMKDRDSKDTGFDQPKVGSNSSYYYTLSIAMQFPHANDSVRLAYFYPFTYSYQRECIKSLLMQPKISQYIRRQAFCRTRGGNVVELLTITNFSGEEDLAEKKDKIKVNKDGKSSSTGNTSSNFIPPSQRLVVFLSARVHPGENNASWVMKGIIQFLTSEDPEAQLLREQVVFKIIPMLNPDGVIVGNYRCNLSGVDLNRKWEHPDCIKNPTIFATKQLLHSLATQRPVLLYCDFHGHSTMKNFCLYGCSEDNEAGIVPKRESEIPNVKSLVPGHSGGSPSKPSGSTGSNSEQASVKVVSTKEATTSQQDTSIVEEKVEAMNAAVAAIAVGWKGKERIFPMLLANRAPSLFPFSECKFTVVKKKRGSARVVFWQELRLWNSFTMEASFCGGDKGSFNGYHYNIGHYEEMGRSFCLSIFDWISPDQSSLLRAIQGVTKVISGIDREKKRKKTLKAPKTVVRIQARSKRGKSSTQTKRSKRGVGGSTSATRSKPRNSRKESKS